jgi:hypothetical protein
MEAYRVEIANMVDRIKHDRRDLNRIFYGRLDPAPLTAAQMAHHCVNGSTYRAYRTRYYRPSSVFRTWVIKSFGSEAGLNGIGPRLTRLEPTSFDDLHTYLLEDPNDFWTRPRGEFAEPGLHGYTRRHIADLKKLGPLDRD